MVNPKTRKQLLFAALALTILFPQLLQTVKAQSIGIGTSTPNASARVDIQATDKGILIPRLTALQRVNISSPAIGLLVYDTDLQGFLFFNGIAWQLIPISNNVWSLTGNSATNPSINYVGTSDNKPLLFRSFNQRVGYLGTHMGDLNVFWGYESGINNTTGFSNVAIGARALAFNMSADNLVAIGDSALLLNTTGTENTAIGSKSLHATSFGSQNTAVGSQALYSNTDYGNTAVGFKTLFENANGTNNTATGSVAMYSNTSGDFNTANGAEALYSNTTGSVNTAIGRSALLNSTTGSDNTAVGGESLFANIDGTRNTAMGRFSLKLNSGGDFNSAFGYNATVSSGNLFNATAIGSNSSVDCNNCMVLGSVNGVNSATSDVNVGIGTSSPTARLDVNGTTKTSQLQVGTGTVMSNIQSGTFTVGPSATGLITVTLTFPTAFASPPKVIATVRGNNFNDTFAASTRSISTTQAVFNIQRVDINGSWAQNLQLDWIAIQ